MKHFSSDSYKPRSYWTSACNATILAFILCVVLTFSYAYGQSTGITTYAQWQLTVFTATQLADPTISGPMADPDHDGVANLAEYAFGGDPMSANDFALSSSNLLIYDFNGQMSLSFPRRSAATDISYIVEVSSDLVNWASGPSYIGQTQSVSGANGFDVVSVCDTSPIGNVLKRFMRMRITTGQLLLSPSGLIVSPISPTAVYLSWNNNASNSGGIMVERSDDGGHTWTTIATLDSGVSSYENSELTTDVSYSYRVVAMAQNSGSPGGGYGGNSSPSNPVNGSPTTSPIPQEIVDLVANTTMPNSGNGTQFAVNVFNQTDPIASLAIYEVTNGNRTKILDAPPNPYGGYTFLHWQNPPVGRHFMIAQMVDNSGKKLVSSVVEINVLQTVTPTTFPPPTGPFPGIIVAMNQQAGALYKGSKFICMTGVPPFPSNDGSYSLVETKYEWSGDFVPDVTSGIVNEADVYTDASSTGTKSINCTVTRSWTHNGQPAPDTTITNTYNFYVVDVQIQSSAQPISEDGEPTGTVAGDLIGTFPFSLNVTGAKNGDHIRVYTDGFSVWALQNNTRTRVSFEQEFDTANLPSFEVDLSPDLYDRALLDSPGDFPVISFDYLTNTGVISGERLTPTIQFNHVFKVEMSPRILPSTGVSRAQVQIEKLYPTEGLPQPSTTIPTSIGIGGVAVTDIHQDEYDPTIFYFTPSIGQNTQVGFYDLQVENVSFTDIATRTLTVKQAIEYTNQVDAGISGFSTAMKVAINEAGSAAEQILDQGGSRDDAETAYEEQTDSHVPISMYLVRTFLDGTTIDDFINAELQNMESAGDNNVINVCQTDGFADDTTATVSAVAITPPGSTASATPNPEFGSASFFADAKSYLVVTGNKIFQGSYGDTQYAVINADDFKLKSFDLGSYPAGNQVGKTIDDTITANSGASIVINGAFFNWHVSEPLTTCGVVLNNGAVQPTSNVGKPSHIASDLRFWFGQVFDHSATQNAGHGLSYQFGGKGNPPIPFGTTNPTDLNAAIGGFSSLILQDSKGTPQKISAKLDDPDKGDTDLNTFVGFKGNRTGFGGIGINRASGMVIIFAKAPTYVFSQSVFDVQSKLYDSGVDDALLTDGGSSVGFAVNNTVVVRSGRHKSPPNKDETVTSYFIFVPNN